MLQNNAIYSEHIFDLAKNKKKEMFYNSSADHAIIVHQALAKYAEQYIEILCGSMCTEISNNTTYLNYLRDFLEKKRDNRIRIILTDYRKDDFEKQDVAKLFAQYPEQVEIRKYDGQVWYEKQPVHFTVTGNNSFRLETDIEKHMAFGNFNSSTQAETLHNLFQKLFASQELTNPIHISC